LSGPWLWLPLVGPIRISTVVAAIAIVTVILWRRRSPILALVTVVAWASVFEIAFQATGTLLHGWQLSYLVWLAAALGGWILLSLLLGIVPDRRLLLGVAVVWVVWVAAGFDSNAPLGPGPGHPATFSVAGEVMNELAKSLLALAYLTGALGRPYAPTRAAGRIGFTLMAPWASTSRATDSPSTSERSRA
jgi:hypothetical protein